MEGSENSQTVQHLWKIGQALATTCPAASRYYIFNLKRYLIDDPSLETKNLKSQKFCEHCGTLWSPENHRVRIQPAPSQNKHIKKLLKLEANLPWKLNNRQKKKLKTFKEGTSKIVYSCFNCKKTVKFKGLKRKGQNFCKRTSVCTLPLNLKPKKSDINAGLFISSPLEVVKKKENEDSQSQLDSLQNQQSKSNSEDILKEENSNLSTNPVSFSKLTSLHQQSLHKKKPSLVETLGEKLKPQKKKKKSLLEQIMKQEQEALKKKTTLASFLVSL